MPEYQNRYIVPETVLARVLVDLHDSVMAFNRRKFGRHRRGTVMLTGVNVARLEYGTWEVVVTFATHRRATRIHVAGYPPFRLHVFRDFRKPLRKLASADTQRRKRKPTTCQE